MKVEEVTDEYQYSLPYTKQDVIDIYNKGYQEALKDIIALSNGEVINGTLKGMIDTELVKKLLTT